MQPLHHARVAGGFYGRRGYARRVLLVFLVGVAMVVAAGVGIAMLVDPQGFADWSGMQCGATDTCSSSEVRVVGGLLAFVIGPIGAGLALASAPWRR